MRPRTPVSLLGALTSLALVLAGCGSQSNIKGALSQSANKNLARELSQVSDAVNAGSCPSARTALAGLDSTISGLPSHTNSGLVANLRQGASTLRGLALRECHGAKPRTTTSSTSTTATTTSTPTTASTSTTTPTVTSTQSETQTHTNTVPGTGGVTTLRSTTAGTNGGGGLSAGGGG